MVPILFSKISCSFKLLIRKNNNKNHVYFSSNQQFLDVFFKNQLFYAVGEFGNGVVRLPTNELITNYERSLEKEKSSNLCDEMYD